MRGWHNQNVFPKMAAQRCYSCLAFRPTQAGVPTLFGRCPISQIVSPITHVWSRWRSHFEGLREAKAIFHSMVGGAIYGQRFRTCVASTEPTARCGSWGLGPVEPWRSMLQPPMATSQVWCRLRLRQTFKTGRLALENFCRMHVVVERSATRISPPISTDGQKNSRESLPPPLRKNLRVSVRA